jgi:glycosyltransferase involved in cell wall biosynthesis
MKEPMLSVVLANYNHGGCLADALRAIVSQTFPAREVIIVEDGSTDNSLEVIARFRRRYPVINLLRNDRNRGVVFSYTRGLAVASGDCVYLASADDMVLPGFFERSMHLLSQYPQAGLCYSELKAFDGREYKSYLSRWPRYFSAREFAAKSKQRGYLYASGINSILRRDALLQAGGIIPSAGPVWDLLAALMVSVRHGACYIPEPLVAIRTVQNSYSGSVKGQGRELREILRNILRVLDRPEYEDIGAWIRQTGVWPMLFPSMPCVLLKERRWRYLSAGLVSRALWVGIRHTVGRRVSPAGKKYYFRLANRFRRLAIAFE